MIQTWGRMMTNPDLHQNRLDWLEEDLEISTDSDTILFVGCLPYYDTTFNKIGFEGLEIARAALKILNTLGIKPQVMAEERCCGHDQLWEGDMETFQALAKLNIESLKQTGAKQIISTCPECVRTLKIDYPNFVEPHGMKVLHLTELLADHPLPQRQPTTLKVTYQDPCNLGRHLGIYQPPRQVLSDIGVELQEMERTKNASLCCGTSCWRACGQVSKNIQVERLKEARSTGAEILVTTCLKCQIHFKCAQNDPILKDHIDIPIQDLTTLVAEMIH
jgi:Fe-S oxidoreductase